MSSHLTRTALSNKDDSKVGNPKILSELRNPFWGEGVQISTSGVLLFGFSLLVFTFSRPL